MICLLIVIGLTPGGSSTVHTHTHTNTNKTQNKTVKQNNQNGAYMIIRNIIYKVKQKHTKHATTYNVYNDTKWNQRNIRECDN
jgi:uncharacterized protein YceK